MLRSGVKPDLSGLAVHALPDPLHATPRMASNFSSPAILIGGAAAYIAGGGCRCPNRCRFDSAPAGKSRSRAPAEDRALVRTVGFQTYLHGAGRDLDGRSLTFRISALGQSARA